MSTPPLKLYPGPAPEGAKWARIGRCGEFLYLCKRGSARVYAAIPAPKEPPILRNVAEKILSAANQLRRETSADTCPQQVERLNDIARELIELAREQDRQAVLKR